MGALSHSLFSRLKGTLSPSLSGRLIVIHSVDRAETQMEIYVPRVSEREFPQYSKATTLISIFLLD